MSTFLVNCARKPFPSKINSINMADDILCQALTTK